MRMFVYQIRCLAVCWRLCSSGSFGRTGCWPGGPRRCSLILGRRSRGRTLVLACPCRMLFVYLCLNCLMRYLSDCLMDCFGLKALVWGFGLKNYHNQYSCSYSVFGGCLFGPRFYLALKLSPICGVFGSCPGSGELLPRVHCF